MRMRRRCLGSAAHCRRHGRISCFPTDGCVSRTDGSCARGRDVPTRPNACLLTGWRGFEVILFLPGPDAEWVVRCPLLSQSELMRRNGRMCVRSARSSHPGDTSEVLVLASTSPSRKLRVADVDAAAAAQWMILEHAFLQSTAGSSYGEHVLASMHNIVCTLILLASMYAYELVVSCLTNPLA